MDPVTAIGLAASILNFVSFSWGLIKGTTEIYHSANGALEENERIEVVIRDLDRIAGDLGKGCTGSTSPELAVKELAEDCKEDSAKLLGLLKKLRVRGKVTIWKSLKAKFLTLMSKDELENLKERLDFYRSEVDTNLILILR
jgi:hypothetical protein